MKIEFYINKENTELVEKAWKWHNKVKDPETKIITKEDFIRELFIDALQDYTHDITPETELQLQRNQKRFEREFGP